MNTSILLVDDEMIILESMRQNLQHNNYTVTTADSGEDAVALLRQSSFDIVITDLVMGGMGGIDVLEYAKKYSPQTAVVILTGHAEMDTSIDALRLGAADYLLKPCVLDELLIRLEKIVEKKDIQKKLDAANEELIQARKMQSSAILAGGVAHDFSNLLTIIMGNVDMALVDAPKDSDMREYLQSANMSVKQAAKLVQKFITFSDGNFLDRQQIPIHNIVHKAASADTDNGSGEIDFLLPQEYWCVNADEKQLTAAIKSVFDNARESMENGGKIFVTIENVDATTLHGKYINISLRDEGKGISESDLEKVFDPYFSTKERGAQKGMGLGLTMAKAIVKKHEGKIRIKSEQGKGTTVIIALPAGDQC